MPSLGPAEILVVLVIALLVFGPDKMPQMARQAGKAFSEFRRVQQHLRSEISGAMSDLGGSGAGAADAPTADAPTADIASSEPRPGGDPVPMLPSKESVSQPDARQPDAPPPPPGATGSTPDPSSSSAPTSAPDLGSGPDPVDPA